MTPSQEPAPGTDTAPDEDTGAEREPHDTTSAEDVETDGPLDADEGDPDLDAYPG